MRSLLPLLFCGCASVTGQGQPLEDTFAEVQSSVVTILTKSREVDLERDRGLTSVGGLGSGALVSADGLILTAAHVVQTADQILVLFPEGTKRFAEVVGSDTVSDVALLKLRGEPPIGAHVAAMGDSDQVRIGQRVFVVGAPRGISHTLTVGHISARHRPERTVHTMFDTELFQTDAAINQGNSGGPMFNMNGEVIGVVSHIVSRSGGHEGLGFAVTINVARELLIDTPAVWTGIEVIRLSGPLARVLNLPDQRSGLLVQHVAEGSPLGRVGLRGGTYPATISGERFVAGGDVVLEVGGMPIGGEDTFEKIRRLVRELQDGDRVEILILRGGVQQTLRLRFER